MKDKLHSFQRDLDKVKIEYETCLTEFGSRFDSRGAECEAAMSEATNCQPRITEVFTKKEAARKEAAREGLPTMRSYSL
eukprot:6179296-Pyramimonas_sp.AAC.1